MAVLVVPLILAVPKAVLPSLNVTVPPRGEPPRTGGMVAFSATDFPKLDGLSDEDTDVVVGALFTVSVNAADVLAESPALPPYTAVIE